MDLRIHNPGGVNEFVYGIELIKTNTKQVFGLNQMVDDISIWQSLFVKAMCAKLLITDASGILDKEQIQPGDQIRVVIYRNDASTVKLDKTFDIMSINMGTSAKNMQGRGYVVNCVSSPVIKNKIVSVQKAMSGLVSDMVTEIAKTYLGIDKLDAETTEGSKKNVLMPNVSPFKAISRLTQEALSAAHGEQQSLYLFYEDALGFHYKSLKQIISDATTHQYSIIGDDTRFGDSRDVNRILSFQQNKIANQISSINDGMIQNEIVSFDIMNRSVSKSIYDDASESLRLLSDLPYASGIYADQIKQGSDMAMDLVYSKSKLRSSDSAFGDIDLVGRLYNARTAQKAMFDQLSYTMTMSGNSMLKPGDLIYVNAGGLSADDSRELDPMLNGLFLIGNVRHQILGAQEHTTVIDVFKDGRNAS